MTEVRLLADEVVAQTPPARKRSARVVVDAGEVESKPARKRPSKNAVAGRAEPSSPVATEAAALATPAPVLDIVAPPVALAPVQDVAAPPVLQDGDSSTARPAPLSRAKKRVATPAPVLATVAEPQVVVPAATEVPAPAPVPVAEEATATPAPRPARPARRPSTRAKAAAAADTAAPVAAVSDGPQLTGAPAPDIVAVAESATQAAAGDRPEPQAGPFTQSAPAAESPEQPGMTALDQAAPGGTPQTGEQALAQQASGPRPQQGAPGRPPAQLQQPGQQPRPGHGSRNQQGFAARAQSSAPAPSQFNDGGASQTQDQRGRRRRRRRGRGTGVGNVPMNTNVPMTTNGAVANVTPAMLPQSYEERAPIVELAPPQRMPVFEVHGMLDFLSNGEAFLREEDLRVRGDDPLIGVRDIRRFDLRNGDGVQLEARPGRGRGPVTVERVLTINDEPFDQVRTRKRFEDLTPIYPDRMIKLETGTQPITTRMLDMFAPVGFGQRALIVSPPKAGKTTILKHIGSGVTTNYPDASLILCLVGERPEEVTDLRVSLPKAIMFASSFDEEVERHGHLAEMAIERAKRLAEQGKDVVVLLDSITRLARAFNLGGGGGGRTLSGGMDASALTTARRIYGAARAIEQGGSVTIIATCLVDTGSRLDDVVYEEFKGTGNMELHLDRGLAERRVFPAIDVSRSSTRKEELLLDPATLKWSTLLRRRIAGMQAVAATEQLIDRLSKTPSNRVFIDLLSRSQS